MSRYQRIRETAFSSSANPASENRNQVGKWECKVIEFNGEENHVHLLFQYHPGVELSKLVNNIKTVTSRRLRSEFESRVDEFYHKDVLWNGSYFIASCGGVTVSTLKRYIEEQNSPS